MGETKIDESAAHIDEDEIDLGNLVRLLWLRRSFLLKLTGIFAVLGLAIAFSSKVEYEASCKLMPESQDGTMPSFGGLGGLAGLAGIDLNIGAAGSLTPELYPQIVNSLPFQWRVLNEPVLYRKLDSSITTYTFLREFDRKSLGELVWSYTVGLPGRIKAAMVKESMPGLSVIRTDGPIELTKEDWKLLEDARKRISASVDAKTGIISVVSELPDPVAAASVAHHMVNELTAEITNYKIDKARVNLEFVEERFVEVQKDYEDKQEKLAIYADQNKNITSSLIRTEYQRLQNELEIALEVYKSLATQLEQAKIKVKEETPVFTVLEPVKIPVEKSKPRRALIVILSTFVGLAIAMVIVVGRMLIDINFLNTSSRANSEETSYS